MYFCCRETEGGTEGREEGGKDWRTGGSKRFVRFGVSPPPPAPAVFLIQVQIAPWGKCRSAAQYSAAAPPQIHTTCYTPLRSYILSDAHNESNSCAVHSSLSKSAEEGRKERRRSRRGWERRRGDDIRRLEREHNGEF